MSEYNSDNEVEYLYTSDSEFDDGEHEQTKCGEILVSFSSFDSFVFVCILCKKRTKYFTLDEFSTHMRGEHLLHEHDTQVISPTGGFVAEHLQDDFEIFKKSDVDESAEDEINYIPSDNLEEAYDELETSEIENIYFDQRIEILMSDEDSTNVDDDQSIVQFEENSPSYRQCMTEVIDIYRKCIGLWHAKTLRDTSREVQDAAFTLLLEKYSTYYPDRTLNDLQGQLNNMTRRFNAEYQKIQINARKRFDESDLWYFKHLIFLRFANDVEVSDEIFQDFNCPRCFNEGVGFACSIDLWTHITTNHLKIEKMDPLITEQTKMFTLQWPEENVLPFIELYREQECLWNMKSSSYHNRSLKADAYKVIIEKYNEINPNILTNRDSVKSTIRHLRDYFGRMDKKYRTCNSFEINESNRTLRRFKIYEKLLFLRNVYMPRRTPNLQIHNCDLCGKSFNKKRDFNAHTKNEHADAIYTCDKCPLEFRSQVNKDLSSKEHIKTDGKTYACPICHLNFENSEGLAIHLNEHLPKNLQNQICEMCGAKFDDRSNLLIHIRRHTNTKNYICDVCDKGFVTSTELKSHIVVHSNERPFVCEVCGLRFKYTNRLNTHRLFHAEPKFKCMDCDMKFVTKRHLNDHQRVHVSADSPVERVNCDICGSLFRNKDSLLRHTRKIHKIKKRGQYSRVKY